MLKKKERFAVTDLVSHIVFLRCMARGNKECRPDTLGNRGTNNLSQQLQAELENSPEPRGGGEETMSMTIE